MAFASGDPTMVARVGGKSFMCGVLYPLLPSASTKHLMERLTSLQTSTRSICTPVQPISDYPEMLMVLYVVVVGHGKCYASGR